MCFYLNQESAVGFDTAVKVYSQLVGNTAIDGASARKYWYFMRLMGQVHTPLPRPFLTFVSSSMMYQVYDKVWFFLLTFFLM